jgi:presenilin-like A22 family membrane protease
MKHNLKIIFILVGVFFLSQVIGLLIINQYIDHEAIAETGELKFNQLPYEVERPPIEEGVSFWYIFGAILIGTGILLLIIKFRKIGLWKFWYFLSVFVTLTVALAAFVNQLWAVVLALLAGFFKIFRPRIWIHNITELFIYGGLAAIFVPIMNVFSAVMLLVLISIYDIYAVWHSKHMVKLAKFTTGSNVFAGLSIPYEKKTGKIKKVASKKLGVKTEKVKNAILGGGDIGFPLLFAGVILKTLVVTDTFWIAFAKSLIIPLVTSVALYILFIKGEKNKFYPAMPFLTAGVLVGYAIVFGLNFLGA